MCVCVCVCVDRDKASIKLQIFVKKTKWVHEDDKWQQIAVRPPIPPPPASSSKMCVSHYLRAIIKCQDSTAFTCVSSHQVNCIYGSSPSLFLIKSVSLYFPCLHLSVSKIRRTFHTETSSLYT